jgi:MoaA/NifB/PqqE/SkfB family radical SAM enzyme
VGRRGGARGEFLGNRPGLALYLSPAMAPAPPQLQLAPIRPPRRVFGFETATFPVRLANRGVLGLSRPEAFGEYVATVDLHTATGAFHRRLLETGLARPIPVGGAETFDASLYMRAFEGNYRARFGLHRRVEGKLVPLALEAEELELRVDNTIFDAFIELVNACNFRCTFCPQVGLQRKQRPMDFELAKKVVGELAEMEHHYPIRVHLMGEPLLYPRFFDFVEHAHGVGQRILLATNGSRFQRDRIEKLFATRLDEMVVSLNTPEREEYDAQRGTDMPFEAYMAGIEAMVAEIVRRGPPPATRINVLYDLAKANDPAELARVRKIGDHWIGVVRRVGGRELPDAHEVVQLDPTGTTLLKLCEGLELQWTPYHNWGDTEREIRNHVPAASGARGAFCSFPWRQLAVLVDGRATACCVDAEGEIVLGDARTQHIREIWNGPELRKIRDGFERNRALHPKCATCTVRHHREEFFPPLAAPALARV